MKLAARIEGVSVMGPGLAGWRQAREILSGRAAYRAQPTVIPAPAALPATERRRAGKCVRLALAAGLEAAAEAGLSARDVVAIFTSSSGDGENCHAILEDLASDDRMISPTRFHNSVHNASAGYWGIATGAMQSADCLAGFDASFGAGLVEAMGRIATQPSQPVLLIAYDAPYPQPLHTVRPIPDSFAVALMLVSPAPSPRGMRL
ncbi:MAG TPA: beta-ketoacyl synthase chain length factor, partial [Usitatibacter sp.]|nr:beta-ketoacyl synthase chain length factor [Usitatibacter sp.]